MTDRDRMRFALMWLLIMVVGVLSVPLINALNSLGGHITKIEKQTVPELTREIQTVQQRLVLVVGSQQACQQFVAGLLGQASPARAVCTHRHLSAPQLRRLLIATTAPRSHHRAKVRAPRPAPPLAAPVSRGPPKGVIPTGKGGR